MLLGQFSKQDVLEKDEKARVKAVFELDEKVAREIMVPAPTSWRSGRIRP
jgi:CBS domain containing-hemolysin-like protein